MYWHVTLLHVPWDGCEQPIPYNRYSLNAWNECSTNSYAMFTSLWPGVICVLVWDKQVLDLQTCSSTMTSHAPPTERCRDTMHQLQVGQFGIVKVRGNETKWKKRHVVTHDTTKGTAPAVGPIHSECQPERSKCAYHCLMDRRIWGGLLRSEVRLGDKERWQSSSLTAENSQVPFDLSQ